ncbi:unnamed protein product, partial [Brassica rapa subsp. trilocularis]
CRGASSLVVSPSLCGFGEWVKRVGVASTGQCRFAATGPRGRSAWDRISRLSLFRELGFSFYWCGVCRWILLPRRRVVARGLKDGRLCRLSGRVLFLLTSNLLFAVHDLFSRLDSIRSRHVL